jgi:UDP-N-acetylglucosamine 2-epimerase
VCVTAQHRELLDQVMALFGIVPDYDLDLMKAAPDLSSIACGVMAGVTGIIEDLQPSMVLVHGDTTTALAASIASFYKRIEVAHIEAGLRTHDLQAPWPEEMNRQVVGRIARLHYAPTPGAAENLLKEGVPQDRVIVTGNTVIDALHAVRAMLRNDKELEARVASQFPFLGQRQHLLLITAHRRENFGLGIEEICAAIRSLSDRNDLEIVFPVHPNPSVHNVAHSMLSRIKNVHLLKPLEYAPFVYLLEKARIVLTDSGGIQEEAPAFGKPVLLMRKNSERPEALHAGTAKLVGATADSIVSGVCTLLDRLDIYEAMARTTNPFGDGMAASRIAAHLHYYLARGTEEFTASAKGAR